MILYLVSADGSSILVLGTRITYDTLRNLLAQGGTRTTLTSI